MTRPIVVGYTATDGGADAAALGVGWPRHPVRPPLEVVSSAGDDRSVITPPDAGYDRYLRDQACTWLAGRPSMLPDPSTTRTQVRYAESFAEGLIAYADEIGAAHIVMGQAGAVCADATAWDRWPRSCCTPPTCRSRSPPTARATSTPRSASPASLRLSARAPVPTRSSRRPSTSPPRSAPGCDCSRS